METVDSPRPGISFKALENINIFLIGGQHQAVNPSFPYRWTTSGSQSFPSLSVDNIGQSILPFLIGGQHRAVNPSFPYRWTTSGSQSFPSLSVDNIRQSILPFLIGGQHRAIVLLLILQVRRTWDFVNPDAHQYQ